MWQKGPGEGYHAAKDDALAINPRLRCRAVGRAAYDGGRLERYGFVGAVLNGRGPRPSVLSAGSRCPKWLSVAAASLFYIVVFGAITYCSANELLEAKATFIPNTSKIEVHKNEFYKELILFRLPLRKIFWFDAWFGDGCLEEILIGCHRWDGLTYSFLLERLLEISLTYFDIGFRHSTFDKSLARIGVVNSPQYLAQISLRIRKKLWCANIISCPNDGALLRANFIQSAVAYEGLRSGNKGSNDSKEGNDNGSFGANSNRALFGVFCLLLGFAFTKIAFCAISKPGKQRNDWYLFALFGACAALLIGQGVALVIFGTWGMP